MNSIKQITSGLSSSLFLAAGLTRLAEKTDPMSNHAEGAVTFVPFARASEVCFPCEFTSQVGR